MIYESEISIFNKDALKTKFGSIQTNFDVTLGKISAIISDSEIEEYISGHTTMNSKLSSVVQDLDGVHTQVSSMKTDYDSHFTSVESHLTTLDTTVSGISASVSTVSQEAIKTDTIYYLATSASSGVTRSTSGWTTTTQSVTAEKRYLWIYHKYTKGDDSTTYTDPVIAGVYGDTGTSFNWNLLLETKNPVTWTVALNTSNYMGKNCYKTISPVPKLFAVNDLVTIAFDWETDATGGNFHVECGTVTPYEWGTVVSAEGGRSSTSSYVDISSSKQSGHFKVTFKVGTAQTGAADTLQWLRIRVDGTDTSGKTFTISNAKAERGSTASDWCTAESEVHGKDGLNGISASGLAFLVNHWSIGSANNGECCFFGYNDKNKVADVDGWVMWNGQKLTITKGPWINPNNVAPYNTPILHVFRTKTSPYHADVWWDSNLLRWRGYMYTTSNSPGTVSDWTWDEATDCILATYVEPSNEAAITSAQLFTTPKKFSELPDPDNIHSIVDTSIDAVEVGGRNLILESKNLSLFSKESSITVTRTDSDCTVTNTSSGTSHFGIYYDVPVVSDSEYVLSAVFANVSGTCTWSIGDTSSGTSRSDWTGICPYTNISNGNLSEVIKIPNDCDKIRIYFSTSGNGSKFTVSNVQLEKGNKATAWTPAPEDVSIEEIATLRYASDSTTAPSAPTSAVTSTATTTGVWTKATPILSGTYKYMYMCDQIKWETGKYTWTAVVRDSALEDLVERVTTAELKITDSAIISTVTETVGGKTALNSVIDQRADSIRLKADKISWSSTYSSMTENGTLTASNVELTGKITATSGYIGTAANGFNISSSAIYNGISSVGATSGTGVYVGTNGINLGGGKFKVTSAGALQWTATNSSMTSDGSMTVGSLTANNYIYVDGNSNSFFKLPLYPFDGNYWFKISNGGLEIVMKSLYHFDSSLTTKTTMKFGSNSSSDKTPIEMTNSEDERVQISPSYICFENNYTGGTSSNTDYRTVIDADHIWIINDNTGKYLRISPEASIFQGSLSVQGTKNRIVETDDYSDRLLYCYETPSPLFGDIGEGEIGEDGKCYVWLDPVFSQTIRTSNYQVSLQSYSPSLTYVMERTGSYFVVGGEPGAKFGWEIKAKQADFAERRLDRFEEQRKDDSVNYGLLASNHINELMEGRYAE